MMFKRLFFILCALGSLSTAIAEHGLVVKPLTGAECITAMNHVGRLVYSGDSLYVYGVSNELIYCDLLGNVQHVRFTNEHTDPSTNVESVQNENILQVKVYPNPTQDLVYVENASGKEVRLFTMDGRLLETIKIGNGITEVDMKNYPTGSYLLFSGTQSFQILKH